MNEEKTIFGITAPKKECHDRKCPFHGTLNVKKKSETGVVISAKMHNSAVIELSRTVFIKKYERYAKSRITLTVHNPECIRAKEGDIVKVFSTRPLSKTIHFVIVQNLGREKHFDERREALQEAKVKVKDKREEVKEEAKENESN